MHEAGRAVPLEHGPAQEGIQKGLSQGLLLKKPSGSRGRFSATPGRERPPR